MVYGSRTVFKIHRVDAFLTLIQLMNIDVHLSNLPELLNSISVKLKWHF